LTVVALFLFMRKRNELHALAEQASGEVKELRAARARILAALSSRLHESRLALDDLERDLGMQARSVTPDFRPPLEDANRSAAALKKEMEDLVQWLSLSQDEESFHPDAFDCKALAEESLAKFQEQLADKMITSEIFMSAGQRVFADRQMTATVLENLISNAIKFTPKSGNISCFSGISDGIVSIGVKDSGVGIDPAELATIFDERTAAKSRQGLSLILCKELVERNGGRMYAESEVGKGSTFYFTLPGKTM
jgi:signal transduction histidine kinase